MTSSLEHIFIDEFGDTSLETQKNVVTNYFILVATLVSDDDIEQVRSDVDKLRFKHFNNSEIKSSNVGRKDTRRIRILHDISNLDVKFYIIAIDKTNLYKNGGLIYKKPFFKFMNGLLYSTLFEVFPNARVTADEHGYPEFMESVKKYVFDRHVPDLFENITFNFSNSKSELMIQISDFIAGTIARVVDKDRLSENAQEFLNILDKQIIRIDEWPLKSRSFSSKIGLEHGSELDEKVRELSFNQATIFVEKNSDSQNEHVIDQVNILNYLLYYFKFVDPYKFISGNELVKHCQNGDKKHYLQSAIIAKLRDEGVIISSSNNGYKIPVNVDDLIIYVEQSHSRIWPMLMRLENANKKIQLATKKEINLLENERYLYLNDAIKTIIQKRN